MTDLEVIKNLLIKIKCPYSLYLCSNDKITTIDCGDVAFDFYTKDGSLKSVYGLNQE